MTIEWSPPTFILTHSPDRAHDGEIAALIIRDGMMSLQPSPEDVILNCFDSPAGTYRARAKRAAESSRRARGCGRLLPGDRMERPLTGETLEHDRSRVTEAEVAAGVDDFTHQR
jgi:hypothetical protein